MKVCILFINLMCGCTPSFDKQVVLTLQAQPVLYKTLSEQLEAVTVPHYHIVSWNASYWIPESNDTIEYAIFSTTNLQEWNFECFTLNTIIFVTNDYPQQFYIIGAHSK